MQDGIGLLLFIGVMLLFFLLSAIDSMRSKKPRGRHAPPDDTWRPESSRPAGPDRETTSPPPSSRRPTVPATARPRTAERVDRKMAARRERAERLERQAEESAVADAPATLHPPADRSPAAEASEGAKAPGVSRPGMLASPGGMRDAFLVMELLRPPLSLRSQEDER